MRKTYGFCFAALCAAMMCLVGRAEAGMFVKNKDLNGPAMGYVFDSQTKLPLAQVNITVMEQDPRCIDKKASTSEDGFYKLRVGLGKIRSKDMIFTSRTTTRVTTLSVFLRYEKPGYKPVEGEVRAHTVYSPGGKAKLFLPDVFMTPQDSEEESAILNGAYYLRGDLEARPESAVVGQDITLNMFFNAPADPMLRDGVFVTALHIGADSDLIYLRDDGENGDEVMGDNIFTAVIKTDENHPVGQNKYLVRFSTKPDLQIIGPDAEEISKVVKGTWIPVGGLVGLAVNIAINMPDKSHNYKTAEPFIFSFNVSESHDTASADDQGERAVPVVIERVIRPTDSESETAAAAMFEKRKYDSLDFVLKISGLKNWRAVSQKWINPDGDLVEWFPYEPVKFKEDSFELKKTASFSGDEAERKTMSGRWTIETEIDGEPADTFHFDMP
jgi:hypothetical protein